MIGKELVGQRVVLVDPKHSSRGRVGKVVEFEEWESLGEVNYSIDVGDRIVWVGSHDGLLPLDIPTAKQFAIGEHVCGDGDRQWPSWRCRACGFDFCTSNGEYPSDCFNGDCVVTRQKGLSA
ncbi:MAG: hypothetical protein AAF497_28945 [Planctomycetota bacterium]